MNKNILHKALLNPTTPNLLIYPNCGFNYFYEIFKRNK